MQQAPPVHRALEIERIENVRCRRIERCEVVTTVRAQAFQLQRASNRGVYVCLVVDPALEGGAPRLADLVSSCNMPLLVVAFSL